MPAELRVTPVDYVCKINGGLSVGSGFCGVHDVAAGAAAASVTAVTGGMVLAAGVAGKGVDLVGALSTGDGCIRTEAYGLHS